MVFIAAAAVFVTIVVVVTVVVGVIVVIIILATVLFETHFDLDVELPVLPLFRVPGLILVWRTIPIIAGGGRGSRGRIAGGRTRRKSWRGRGRRSRQG